MIVAQAFGFGWQTTARADVSEGAATPELVLVIADRLLESLAPKCVFGFGVWIHPSRSRKFFRRDHADRRDCRTPRLFDLLERQLVSVGPRRWLESRRAVHGYDPRYSPYGDEEPDEARGHRKMARAWMLTALGEAPEVTAMRIGPVVVPKPKKLVTVCINGEVMSEEAKLYLVPG